MDPERREQLKRLFERATHIPAGARTAFLDEACPDDPDLREELSSLLRAAERADPLFEDLAEAIPLLSDRSPWSFASDAEDLSGCTVRQYRIEERLGSGGMGVVYRAHDTRLDRTVALKFLPPHVVADEDAAERFAVEARAAAALDHPNVCNVHEIGRDDEGRPFIAMAYYEGETLKQKLKRGPLPVKEAADYATQIAAGLAAAHAHGIVHRDVKPGNVIVTSEGVAKILDFGLAKLADVTLTGTGVTLGTVAYMSPEQTRGEELDSRTDLWSLGVVLYEMLTGQRPFRAERQGAVIHAIRHDDPQPPSQLRKEVPPEVEGIVLGLLSKGPAAREKPAERLAPATQLAQQLATAPRLPAARDVPRRRRLKPLIVIGLTVLAVAAGLFAWLRPRDHSQSVPSVRLVVIPFENLGSPEDDFFADGLVEEIASLLGEVRELGIIARTSAIQYKNTAKPIRQIGDELDVAYVLEGTVRWQRDVDGSTRVRITPRLIRVADGTRVWAARYDTGLDDIFDIQSDIAQQTVRAVGIALREREGARLRLRPTTSTDAYTYYLHGLHYLHYRGATGPREALGTAVELFERALALDPGFAAAYARLAQAHLQLYWFASDPSAERLARAKAAVDSALRRDPELPVVQRALGFYYYHGLGDYEQALEQFERTLARAPSEHESLGSLGLVLRRLGREEAALEVLQKAAVLDPLNMQYWILIGGLLRGSDRFLESDTVYGRALSLQPDNPFAHAARVSGRFEWKGDGPELREVLDAALARVEWGPFLNEMVPDLAPATRIEVWVRNATFRRAALTVPLEAYGRANSSRVRYYVMRAGVHRASGERETARAYWDSVRTFFEDSLSMQGATRMVQAWRHVSLGTAYAMLGQPDTAVYHGRRAVELVPVAEDFQGEAFVLAYSGILTLIGDYEGAIERLEYLRSKGLGPTLPVLRDDPLWTPLRELSRFQRLISP